MAGRIWRLEIVRDAVDNVLILTIAGRIGSAAAPALARALEDARTTAPAVIVDLAGVDYISGPGLSVLQSSVNGATVLCCLTEPVRIALELAGLTGELSIEPSRAAAIARLHSPTMLKTESPQT
jgi:anti-anti-sigma factor